MKAGAPPRVWFKKTLTCRRPWASATATRLDAARPASSAFSSAVVVRCTPQATSTRTRSSGTPAALSSSRSAGSRRKVGHGRLASGMAMTTLVGAAGQVGQAWRADGMGQGVGDGGVRSAGSGVR